MAASSKRRPSPPPSSSKRAKTEYQDTKLDYYTPPPLPLTAPNGVERIPLPPSLNPNRLSSQYLSRITSERVNILREQGRHVVDLPMVLNDGIVLNWVLHKSGSVGGMRSPNANHNPLVARRSVAWVAENRSEILGPLVVSSGSGSGTSTTDAIVIDDSDEDLTGVSSLSHIDTLAEQSTSHATLDKDVIDSSDSDSDSDSDRGFLSLAHSVGDKENANYLPRLPANISGVIPSVLPSGHAPMEEVDVAATSEPRFDCTAVSSSDFEVDGVDEEISNVDGVADSTISAPRHAKSPSPSSLQPMGKLFARRRRHDGSVRKASNKGVVTASREREREELHKEALAIASSEDEGESDRPASNPQLKRVPLPKTDNGRARRLLMPESAELPLVAVTMRGDCHFIERRKKHRISGYSLPNPGVFRHVEDACMVGDTAILGCDKGMHQVSFVSVVGKPQTIDVTWCPHSNGPRYQVMQTQSRGVSRLAAIHAEGGHIKFLSGGYDGTIHKWTAGMEKLNEARSRKVVSHGACIMALAYRDHDRSIMASAQRRLHITDLNRCKTMTHPFSNDIQQIHIHPQAAYITLLEVRHLDRQIQLFDSRKGDFDGEPCLSFGHRNTSGKFSGMYTRGSVHLVHFATTTDDGCVLLWDFRNSKRAVVERRFRQAEKVAHTIFADRDIATFGRSIVTFFEDYLTG